MAYVSSKDGAHTQNLGATTRASERMPIKKYRPLYGHKLIYINPQVLICDVRGAAQLSLRLRINRFVAPLPAIARASLSHIGT
jgi:hypothetical protein